MTNSPSFKRIVGRALMVSAAALIGFASTAQAGFEWRGPLEPPVKPITAPASDQGMSGLAPVTTWDGTESGDVQWGQDNAALPVEAAPMQTPATPSPALAPFVAETPLPEPVEAGDVIAGFGTNLPLVIALQQVVPHGYQYAFAEGVNLGAPVSWEGGKGWRAVLSDMLSSEGLGYRVRDNVVVVGYYPPEEILPPENMMSAPVATSSVPADAPAVTWHESAATSAPAPADAPVTIRRQKPSAFADGRTEGNVAQIEVDTSAPATQTWQTSPDRTASQSRQKQMSYPPEKTSSAPVAVSSAPPAAQNQVSTSEAAQPLSVPPPMDMGIMSAAPPDGEDIVTSAPAAADVAAAEETQAPAATPAPAVTAGNWRGNKGTTLRDTLKSWSDSAGVELYWSIDYDYRLKKDIGLDGSYDQAVAELLDQFSDVRPQPYGQLHQGDGGPRVLVVRSYDLTP